MEHLCAKCIKELAEDWYYKPDEMEVAVVTQDLCDNTSDDDGILNIQKDLTYPENLKIVTVKKGGGFSVKVKNAGNIKEIAEDLIEEYIDMCGLSNEGPIAEIEYDGFEGSLVVYNDGFKCNIMYSGPNENDPLEFLYGKDLWEGDEE